MSHLVTAARWYAERGFIPLQLSDPRDASDLAPGKRPLGKSWQTTPYADPDAVAARFASHSGNIGMRMGACPAGRVVALDVDGPEGASTLAALERELGALPPTLTSRSGRAEGGEHRVFVLPDGAPTIGNASPVRGGHLDVRGEAGQIVVAPSIHPATGAPYQWTSLVAPATLPAAWVARLVQAGNGGATGATVRSGGVLDSIDGATIPEGERRNKLFRVACAAHAIGADVAKVVHAANERCVPPLPHPEVAHLITDVIRRYPAGHGLSDLGNAERFYERYAGAYRYCGDLGGWLEFDGRRWRANEHGVTRAVAETIRALYVEAAACTDDDAAKQIRAHAKACEAAGRIASCRTLAESKCDLPPEAFDRDPWIFVAANATIDLRNLTPRAHDAKDLATQAASDATVYDPVAVAPTWEAFLSRCWPDPSVRAFLQRWCGLLLSGDCSEQKWLLLTGEGNNGKGVLVHTLTALLGSYAYNAPTNFLTKRKNEPHPTELMAIRGKRAIFQSETEKGATWNEERLKQLTGRDPITARLISENFVTFEPTGKIMVCANDAPIVEGDNHAFWRRILTLKCGVIIPPEEIDIRLEEKLRLELSGILNWCIAGLADYYRTGLRPPPAVVAAAAEYRESEDPLIAFIEQCTKPAPGGHVDAGALYQAYSTFARRGNVEPISINAFGRAMQRRGFTSAIVGANRSRVRTGITLIDPIGVSL